MIDPIAMLRPKRHITGISAILLPPLTRLSINSTG
jgi:hypothetical protein